MRRLVLAAFGLLSAAAASSSLTSISLEEFKRRAPCACRVRVEEVTRLEVIDRRGDELDGRASMRVLESFGACDSVGENIDFRFSDEVHSSHPIKGEEALVFPVRRGEWFTEAVYGRSYWNIRWIDDEAFVSIYWRNSFLLQELKLQFGESAFVAVTAVKRLWTED